MIERGIHHDTNFKAPKPLNPAKDRINDMVNLLRVSPYQQTAATIHFTSAIMVGIGVVSKVSEGKYFSAAGLTAVYIFNAYMINDHENTARQFLSKYKKIKHSLEREGWDKAKIEPLSETWCGRNLAKVAANDSGYGPEANDYFKRKGYKWYHIVPDNHKWYDIFPCKSTISQKEKVEH